MTLILPSVGQPEETILPVVTSGHCSTSQTMAHDTESIRCDMRQACGTVQKRGTV
jgi:hypothetical protein